MDKITTFLWFDGKAEEAAGFYTKLFPGSSIDKVTRSTIEYPGGDEGDVITIAFTLPGRQFSAMNGGPGHPFTDAISLSIECEDQAEIDHYWDSLAEGGEPIQCGWVRDRYGLSWQVVPSMLPKLLADPDRAKAKRVMEAMISMTRFDIGALQRAADERA